MRLQPFGLLSCFGPSRWCISGKINSLFASGLPIKLLILAEHGTKIYEAQRRSTPTPVCSLVLARHGQNQNLVHATTVHIHHFKPQASGFKAVSLHRDALQSTHHQAA